MVARGGHAGDCRGRAGPDGLGLVDPGTEGILGIRGFTGLYAVGFGGVGALVTWRRPGHLAGWISSAPVTVTGAP